MPTPKLLISVIRIVTMRKKSKRQTVASPISLGLRAPYVVGEARWTSLEYPNSKIRVFAERNLHHLTGAERRFETFLCALNDGVLRGRFRRQHVVSGKWIVDFFFPEIRLAIEIDGSFHQAEGQPERDRQKDADCAAIDITLFRITNAQVFGDEDSLRQLLREAWGMAKRRENRIIGKPYQPSP